MNSHANNLIYGKLKDFILNLKGEGRKFCTSPIAIFLLATALQIINSQKSNYSLRQVILTATGVDPTKLFFFNNKDFFRFLMVSYIQKKIIDSKMT